MRNPFKPSAGSNPPEVIGRFGVLATFERGLTDGSGAIALTIITGARGVGKTVMLGVAEDLARGCGWGVVTETATQRSAGRLREWIPRQIKPAPWTRSTQ